MGSGSITLHRSPWLWLYTAIGIGVGVALLPPDLLFTGIAGLLLLLALCSPLAATVILFTVSPLRALVTTEAPGLLPFDIGQAAFALLLVSWIARHLIRRRSLREAFHYSPLLIPIALFIASTAFSLFSAYSAQSWLTEWLKWVQMSIVIVVLLDLGRDYGWRWLLIALVMAAIANALIGIYQYYGGSGALHLVVESVHFRAFGTFGQPNPFGGFMGLIAPIAVTAALASWRRWWNNQHHPSGWAVGQLVQALFFTFGSAITLTALYFSWSRGAWLGAGASIVIVVLAIPRKISISLAIIGFGIGLMLLATASGRIPQSIVSRLNSITGELASAGDVRGIDINAANYANLERLAHWQAALSMGAAYPWTGVGFGNYEDAYFEFSLLNWDIALGHAHNYYLNIFAETGIIGFTAYTSMMLFIFALTWRLRQHPDPSMRLIGIGVLGSWSYLMVHSLTDNLYVNNLFLHIGALFALVALLRDRLLRVTHG